MSNVLAAFQKCNAVKQPYKI